MSDLDLSKLLGGGGGSSAPSKPAKSPTTQPGDSARRIMDGQITEYTENSTEGIEDVERMLENDPDNLDLADWVAFLYYSNNLLDKAIATYRRLLAADHRAESQYFYLGNAYYKKGLQQLAVEQWKRCITTDPDGPNARKAQARIDECLA